MKKGETIMKHRKTRWKPHFDYVIFIGHACLESKDRAAAIDIVSNLHLQLKRIIRLCFCKEEKPIEKDSLLGVGAPLGDFCSTALAAYRLNKIPKILYNDLKKINTIRNKFAHNSSFSFKSKEIIDGVNSLYTLKMLKQNDSKLKIEKDTCTRAEVECHGWKGSKLDFLWVASYLSYKIDAANNTCLLGQDIKEVKSRVKKLHGEQQYKVRKSKRKKKIGRR